MKYKILVLQVMDNWGGGETFLYDLIKEVDDFDFMIHSPKGFTYDKLKKDGFNVVCNECIKKIFKKDKKWTLLGLALLLNNVIKGNLRLIKDISNEKVDIVFANGIYALLFCILPAFCFNKKIIVTQHLIYKKKTPEAYIIRLFFPLISKFVCVSNSVKSNLLEILGKSDDDKISVIYNAIRYFERENKTFRSDRTLSVGVVGTITRSKGLDTILNAFSEIKIDRIILNVFGETHNDVDSRMFKNELILLAKQLSIEDRVVFKGRIEDKREIFKDIDILVNYSNIPESFSYVVLEGLAYGKIVIASDVGGPSEIIQNGISGFLVPANDIQTFIFVLRKVIDEYDNMTEIRNNAVTRAKLEFGIQKFKNSYKELFEKELKK